MVKFYAAICDHQHRKCIKMSINKPTFGLVVLEIVYCIFIKQGSFFPLKLTVSVNSINKSSQTLKRTHFLSCITLLFKRRYGTLPTMHCSQWDILYRLSCGVKSRGWNMSEVQVWDEFIYQGMFILYHYHDIWPSVQNIPLEAMHCGKYTISALESVKFDLLYKIIPLEAMHCGKCTIFALALVTYQWASKKKRTTCWLAEIIMSSFIWSIRESVRKINWIQVWETTFSKPYYNWLNKLTFHETNQSGMTLHD